MNRTFKLVDPVDTLNIEPILILYSEEVPSELFYLQGKIGKYGPHTDDCYLIRSYCIGSEPYYYRAIDFDVSLFQPIIEFLQSSSSISLEQFISENGGIDSGLWREDAHGNRLLDETEAKMFVPQEDDGEPLPF